MIFQNKLNKIETSLQDLIEDRFNQKINFTKKKISAKLDLIKSNNKDLYLNIIENEREVASIIIPIETLDGFLGIKPEVIYIGQSFASLDRLKKHEKIVEIQSRIKEEFDMRIYLFDFKFGYGGINKPEINQNLHEIMLSNSNNRGKAQIKIDLLERFLIYFFQPEMNTRHTKTSLKKDKEVLKNLVPENIFAFTLDFSNNLQNGYNFWTKNQFLKEKIVSYNFLDSEEKFYKDFVNFPNTTTK